MTVLFCLQGIEFEWDEDKAAANLEKHGVTFEEAAEAFFDRAMRQLTKNHVSSSSDTHLIGICCW